MFDSVATINSAIYDLRFYDTCDLATIRNAQKVLLATEFDAQTDTTIYLSASYCAVAINDIKVCTNDHAVLIYDWMGNKIFDSGDYTGQNMFDVKCRADYSNRGLAPADANGRYWAYDGTNNRWDITPIS